MLDDFNEDREKLHFDIKHKKCRYLQSHKDMLEFIYQIENPNKETKIFRNVSK